MMDNDHLESKNKACLTDAVGCLQIYCLVGCSLLRECIKLLVNHRRFQQCILLAILINTLSMGIEYHNQVNEEQNDLPFRYYLCLLLFTTFIIIIINFFLSSSIHVIIYRTNVETRNSYASWCGVYGQIKKKKKTLTIAATILTYNVQVYYWLFHILFICLIRISPSS